MASAPEPLRLLFEAATGELPSDAEIARLRARLRAILEPSGIPYATLGKVAALVGLVVGGAVVASPGVEPARERTAALELPALGGHSRAKAGVHAPAPTAHPATDVAAPAPHSATAVAVAPPDEASLGSTSERAAPAREPARPEHARSVLRTADSEAALLERARRALASSPARSLALTEEHRQRYPNGALGQEGEVIAIEALRRLGRDREASRRADDFARAYPGSAHAHKLDAGRTE